MKTILITGAAGGLGRYLREELAGKYKLRLSDRIEIADLSADESFVAADVTEPAGLTELANGCDAIVHLGGIPAEHDWDPILQTNIIGTYNIYEAARLAGVPRVIFASSNHAMGFYPREQTIPANITVRPDSRYGVSKAFGEALASMYADKYGVHSLVLRIGNVDRQPVDVRRLSIWISPRDLAQLVVIGVEHPDVHCDIVYGVSDNARGWYDNSAAEKLGYKPQDRSEDYAAQVLEKFPAPGDGVADTHQGGDFCVVERGGGVVPPDKKA